MKKYKKSCTLLSLLTLLSFDISADSPQRTCHSYVRNGDTDKDLFERAIKYCPESKFETLLYARGPSKTAEWVTFLTEEDTPHSYVSSALHVCAKIEDTYKCSVFASNPE